MSENISHINKARHKRRDKTGWTMAEIEENAKKELKELKNISEEKPDNLVLGDMGEKGSTIEFMDNLGRALNTTLQLSVPEKHSAGGPAHDGAAPQKIVSEPPSNPPYPRWQPL